MIELICMACAVVSVVMTTCALIFSCLAYSKVIGMEKSTHKVQWVPVDDQGGYQNPTGKELADKMAKAFDEFPEEDHV